jgi:hypothetical protein
MFCKKELELWDKIAGFGPRGCKDINTQLGSKIGRSRAQIKRYLRNMREHILIDVIPGFAELQGGKFVKPYRYRKIIALPWPTKRAWQAAAFKKMAGGVGSKMSHYQKRITKSNINQARYDLLYSAAGSGKSAESPASPATCQPQGVSPPEPPCCSGQQDQIRKLVRIGLIEKFISVGHGRARAIHLADIKIGKLLVQTKKQVTPTKP